MAIMHIRRGRKRARGDSGQGRLGKAETDGGFGTGGGGGSGLTLRQAAAPSADTVSWPGFATSAYR